MDIRPILSTLARHKTAAALIVLEVALSCAIICNAVFLITQRLERIDRPTGLATEEIVRISMGSLGENPNADALVKQDVASLRTLPGVKAAGSINHVPFDNSSWNSSIQLAPQQERPSALANVYLGDAVIDTLGVTLAEGRDFTADEYVNWTEINKQNARVVIPSVILSRDLANKLFPGESAVGKNIYAWNADNAPHRVIGVVDRLIRTNDNGGPAEAGFTMILPVKDLTMGTFALRTTPERRADVQKAAIAMLEKNSSRRLILREGTFTDIMADYYRGDRAMAWLLLIVIVSLLVVTALGIVGLASFWVQQRTKQIGIRRALGATKGQILRYFQTENFLLATIGIVIGMILAYGINQLLMGKYELPRLPLLYLPVGAVLLWLLGQVAVYGPARKAASVPPAVATRTA
jgi:putative ABC transport system permease protein